MQAFYDSVLPAGSVLVATRRGETKDTSPNHYLVATRDGLEALLSSAVQQGLSVHMALGGFADQVTDTAGSQYVPKTTTLTPVSARAVALDLDVGDAPNKYNSIEAAQSSVAAALAAGHLPTPTWLVLTGGGMHLYWAFTEDVPIEQWFDLQYRFHHHARKHLTLDPGGTTRAHVLQRSPQSYNYKFDPPRKCMLHPTGNALVASELDAFLPAADVPDMHMGGSAPEYGVQKLRVEFFTAACGQLARIVEHGAHSRDDWIAIANASYYMTHGDKVYHDASSKYPEYNVEESQHTLEEVQANATAGPWPCHKFSTGHQSICEGCPARKFGARNPVTAARMAKDQWDRQQQSASNPAPAQAAPETAEQVPAETASDIVPGATDDLLASLATPVIAPELVSQKLANFYVDSGTLFYTRPGKGDIPDKRIKVAYPAMDIVSRCIIEDSDIPGLIIQPKHERSTRSFFIPKAVICNPRDMLAHLAHHEITVHDADLMRDYLNEQHQRLYDGGEPTRHSYVRFGWKSDTVMLDYNGLFDVETGEREAPTCEAPVRDAVARHGGQAGDIGGWLNALQVYNAPEMTALLVPTLLSLGSPLLARLNEADMGVYSLWGRTGTGKSTASEFATSAWGYPARQHLVAQTSAVTILHSLATHHHMGVCIDEVTTMPAPMVQDLIMQMTQGQEKDRLTSSITTRRPGTWRNVVTCTTNTSIVELLSSGKGTSADGAMVSRVLEVRHDVYDPTMVQPIEAARQMLRDNHGLFGPRFLHEFYRHAADYTQQYHKLRDYFINSAAQSRHGQQNLRFRSVVAALSVLSHGIAKAIDARFPLSSTALSEWFVQGMEQSSKVAEEVVNADIVLPDHFISTMGEKVISFGDLDKRGISEREEMNQFVIVHKGLFCFNKKLLAHMVGHKRSDASALLMQWQRAGYLDVSDTANSPFTKQVYLPFEGASVDITRFWMVCIKAECTSHEHIAIAAAKQELAEEANGTTT